MKRNAMQSKHRQPPPKKETPCHSYKEGMEVKRRKELKICNLKETKKEFKEKKENTQHKEKEKNNNSEQIKSLY